MERPGRPAKSPCPNTNPQRQDHQLTGAQMSPWIQAQHGGARSGSDRPAIQPGRSTRYCRGTGSPSNARLTKVSAALLSSRGTQVQVTVTGRSRAA